MIVVLRGEENGKSASFFCRFSLTYKLRISSSDTELGKEKCFFYIRFMTVRKPISAAENVLLKLQCNIVHFGQNWLGFGHFPLYLTGTHSYR